MNFKVVGKIEQERTFASGSGIREIARLVKVYGKGRWQKRKGVAVVQFQEKVRPQRGREAGLGHGTIRAAEVHWYEATGIGRKEFKIKHFVD